MDVMGKVLLSIFFVFFLVETLELKGCGENFSICGWLKMSSILDSRRSIDYLIV
jgi:hypothetical protein